MKNNQCSSVSICGYNFPESAKFGKVIPKSKIYAHAAPGAKVKECFVQEVTKITWAYKLSPTTINLPATADVQEIQVFEIELKTGDVAVEVLQTIDKAIPSPILFVLKYQDSVRYVAACKRPHDADKTKWVLSGYFESEWTDTLPPTKGLPVVLNMGALYEELLKALIPLPVRQAETLKALVLRVDQLRMKEREVEKLESRIKKEKQFNRRVELNRTLNNLKEDIEELQR